MIKFSEIFVKIFLRKAKLQSILNNPLAKLCWWYDTRPTTKKPTYNLGKKRCMISDEIL